MALNASQPWEGWCCLVMWQIAGSTLHTAKIKISKMAMVLLDVVWDNPYPMEGTRAFPKLDYLKLDSLITGIDMRLNLYSLTLVCIFSQLFSIPFLRCWQGEFVQQSRVSLVADHRLYSCNLDVWFRSDVVRRNKMLVTLKVKGLKKFY